MSAAMLACTPDPLHIGDPPPTVACETDGAQLVAGICFDGATRVFDASLDLLHVLHGDFAGDRNVDLIAVGLRDSTVGAEMWLGTPTGPDASSLDPMLTGCSAFPVAGPLLISGRQDLLFATCSPRVDVYPGGESGFGPPVPIDLPVMLRSTVIDDVEGDGDADLVVLGEDAAGLAALSVTLRKADGLLGTPSLQPLPSLPFDPSGISSADFDGDGILDIVIRNPALPGALGYALGAGDGTFAEFTLLLTDLRPLTLSAADFDGDGDDDLAFSDDEAAQVCMWVDGVGRSSTPDCWPISAFLPTGLAAGDLDDDGIAEIVFADATAPTVWIWDPHTGDGADDVQPLPLPAPCNLVEIVDLNADGRLDILAAHFASRALSIRFAVP